jgi:hypothetical protein
MTEQQILTDIQAVSDVLDGVASDQTTLVADAEAIQAELTAGGTVTPATVAAFDALVTRAQGIKTALDTTTASVTALATPTPPPPTT